MVLILLLVTLIVRARLLLHVKAKVRHPCTHRTQVVWLAVADIDGTSRAGHGSWAGCAGSKLAALAEGVGGALLTVVHAIAIGLALDCSTTADNPEVKTSATRHTVKYLTPIAQAIKASSVAYCAYVIAGSGGNFYTVSMEDLLPKPGLQPHSSSEEACTGAMAPSPHLTELV